MKVNASYKRHHLETTSLHVSLSGTFMIQTIADSFYTDVIIWPDTQYCRKCKVKEKNDNIVPFVGN